MNAVLPVVIEPAVDTSQLGEITAAWQITSEALIVIGWRREKSSADGSVAHPSRGAPKGRFHSVSWPFPGAGDTAYHFAAALQLPIGAGVRPGETLLMIGKTDATGVLARLPARFLDSQAFATELARVAAGNAVAVTHFLTRTFSPPATRGNGEIRGFLYTFFERASSPDGCIEIVGAIEGRCVILQGWGAAPGPGCDAVVIGTSVECQNPKLALFARPDMRGNASGQVVVLPGMLPQLVSQIEAIVLLDRRGLRWRPVVRERRLLCGTETISHLRSALPGWECDAETRMLLEKSLRPRFDGRFTLYDGGHPVRLAVDLAVASLDAGIYITGWLYDPKAIVTDILLCSTRGGSAQVNKSWTRIIRGDVTEAFLNDPVLPQLGADQNQHGFAIHVASLHPSPGDDVFYLDVSFQDGLCGFVPITISPGEIPDIQTRLLASVDLHKPSGVQIIENHLAPFFLRLAAAGTNFVQNPPPSVPKEWTKPIVVPLADHEVPRALLSQFLAAPLVPGEVLVFVCGENWADDAVDGLRALTSFYGYLSTVLRVKGIACSTTALFAVSTIFERGRLLLLAPGTIGRSPGWRQALHNAMDAAGGMTCISPTVVYEDESICFDGTDRIEPLESSPYVRIRRRLVGMPVGMIDVTQPEPTVTISPACCLIPCDVALRLGTLPSAAAMMSAQEIALSSVLARNGLRSIWTPAAQVYSADAPLAAVHDNTTRVGQLVGGWCSRADLSVKE